MFSEEEGYRSRRALICAGKEWTGKEFKATVREEHVWISGNNESEALS